jgi:hypothetical protein
MKPWMICALFCLIALSGGPAEAQAQEEPVRGPGFDFWGTGEGSFFYHRLSGDCDTVQHRHGRNAAWGRWVMPLSMITEGGPEEGEQGAIVLRFSCRDGADCIQSGRLANVTGRTRDHAIPFETMERARAFSRQVADLKVACSVPG